MHWWRQRHGKDMARLPNGNAKPAVPCSIPQCDYPSYAKGMCSAHYQRSLDGRPMVGELIRRKAPLKERVELRLRLATADSNGCLIAHKVMPSTGYGPAMKDDLSSSSIAAHRAVYKVFKGPIPPWAQIHHACGVRACINPDHLVLASQKANTAEMHGRTEYERRIAFLEAQLADHHCEGCTCTG